MALPKVMLNCAEATRLLSEGQDRELPRGERTVLRMHTWMCSGCRNFGEQLGFLRQATRAYARGEGDQGRHGDGGDGVSPGGDPKA
ncbi:MAG: zf-HC2 domain-containing protein [Burkholderiales bacterium]|nr:zf-HC2 domain-containing protein [Burkholderiales bacterium]MBH2015613.1 zf-HC2 domain-containing protein [Burkholderiales bacterium]